ncbi:histidinol-phosphate transaminase [Pontiella sulfatireligans]|uniref:Histidinol-phosphate aminotransferase n=1 Tax=Pontiella sulfatireligans TaxID=2750658 RepID=A0A6C2UJK3_9BACT|nr:histidinol-phosphate transaminase [Pontiella sulfatireligans]VGO20139.1 Histidinol-phosphate aminotransferase [Pontiella sulfatireligans]
MSDLIRKSVQAMAGYVPGEQPKGEDIVKLNTNENPYLPSADVQDILSMIDVAVLSRYPDPVCIELRKAIAELHGCEVENVFVGNGSDEVLALCIRAFVERDGSVGFFDPSYSLYSVLADIEDVEKKPVVLGPAFQWQMPDDYASSLFFLTNPNAPTSMQFSKANVGAFVKDFKGVVLVDEAYADFAAENCMDLALQHDNVLVARTLSKAYSLAGIRLGYCVGNADLIGAMYKIKDSYNVNYLTQEVARVAILDQDTMKANVQAIVETRKITAEKLSELGFEVAESQSNFLWVKPLDFSAKGLFEELRKKNIVVRYFGNDELTKDYLRITIGTAPEMFKFLDVVEELMRDA